MKQWIKNNVLLFIKWFFTKNIELCSAVIKQFYQLVRKTEFKVHEIKEVNVKKGKCRYTLLFIETTSGNVRLNMGKFGREKIDKPLTILS